jgi:DNA-binding PadR family transcriptional regulator
MELTALEQQVMLAIMRLQPTAYGISIQDKLAGVGKTVSFGTIYACLDRLEEKGFVQGRQGEATRERGGRRKLYFALTARGQHTLRASLQGLDELRVGIRWAGEKAHAAR